MWRFNCFCLTLGLLMALSSATASADSIALQFEQVIDLDSGLVSDASMDNPADADVKIGYNADRTEHAVVIPLGGTVQLAFIADTVCTNVIPADIEDLTFSVAPVDQSIGTEHCVVIRTDQGALFKLGNAVEADLTVTIDLMAL